MDEIPKAIAQSTDGVRRVSEIVKSMKDFSYPEGEDKVLLDVNGAIKSTVTITRNEWKYVAELETVLNPDIPLVLCFPGMFNQVILNLIVNAAHAIGDVVKNTGNKGKITVSTETSGDDVVVKIADTGTGIPENIRHKIFDPFFTTKEVGKGTGQGLAIAHTVIVEKHNGSITFESEMGKGTTFIIRIRSRSQKMRRVEHET
jgi:signal transduction histidine kinase